MDIITELIRYIIIFIIGIILVNWYERKKWGENRFKTSLVFILSWRTVIFLIVIIMNLIIDLFLLESLYNLYYYIIYLFMMVTVTFFINIFLGVNIFKFIYNKKTQESIFIILIIVIIDIILESFLFYIILIPESLIFNFNL